MSQSPSDDRLGFPNPFGRLVGDPLSDSIDVAEINRQAFEACQNLILEVGRQGVSGALTLIGEAGAGKTHLLARVRRWLQIVPASLFVPVRMDTTAQMLWRHLRRNLADALLRPGSSGQRAIDHLLGARKAEIGELAERDLGIVLEQLLQGQHVRDTSAWLRGQDLPESVLERLALAAPGPDENQEVNARNIVAALCWLLAPGTVVFCLDQWEALQSAPGETAGLHAAGQAVSFLHDPPVRNACIVCCLQTSFLPTLERMLDEATRQRMLGRREAIEPLDWEKARRLVVAFLDASAGMAALRRERDDELWPLTEKPIREVFRDGQAPARKVISRCKDLFELWRTGAAPSKEPLEAVLPKMWEERLVTVPSTDAEAVLQNGLPVLFDVLGMGMKPSPKPSPFDFVSPVTGARIALCNQTNSTALAARLKRIVQALQPAGGGPLLLLRDARLAVSPTASVTRERLASIEKAGGRLAPVSQEAIEALHALRHLLADAQSGDLAHNGDPISSDAVQEWIAAHLPEALHDLAEQIGRPDGLSAGLANLLAGRRIVSLEEAARELNSRPEEVELCARRDPRLFGMLGGATPVLFQPVHAGSSGS